MIQTEVNISCTPVFWANKKAYDEGRFRVIANQGSTRSSKTFSISQLLVDIASGGINGITGKKYGKTQISIVSPAMPHLKKGARKDVLNTLEALNMFNEDNFNRTDHIYTFPSGSTIEFFGADNSKKVMGPGRKILYVNEANLLGADTYRHLALRTEETIFIDFNPADEFSYVYDVADRPGNKLIISTYLNNKVNLAKAQIEEIEALKEADENAWRVFGLGLRGTSTETIYTHWKTCGHLPGRGETFYGQDFGYNVPSALVKVELFEGAIYVDEVIYETKLTTGDLIEQYKALSISKGAEIFCDAAEPKTIEELRRAGYNARSAVKDVREGIRKIKSMPLFVTSHSTNLIKELKSYKWRKGKDGKNEPDEPVKFMDHGCDAMRYAVFTKMITPKKTWSFV